MTRSEPSELVLKRYANRRRFLQGVGTAGIVGAAGCLGDDNGDDTGEDDDPNGGDGPFFEVSDLSPGETTVMETADLSVTATITNTGDDEGTQDVSLRVAGTTRASETITLGHGENEEVSLDTTEVAIGDHEYGIYSTDDAETATLTVEGEDRMGDDPAVLVFSATDGFRHANIEDGNERITEMGSEMIERHAAVRETEADSVTFDVIDDPGGDASEFPDDASELDAYDVVVWNNTTGDLLDDEQQAAFEAYIENGGGFAGIHSASDTHYDWEWYGELVGAYFEHHPPGTHDAELKVTDSVHPSTEFLPAVWERHDEWYDFDRNPRGDVHVLATLDEDTYEGAEMDNGRVDHPIAWCQEVENGRSWYTASGHTSESWEEDEFVEHAMNGIMWAAGWLEGDASATVWDSYERTELAGGLDEPMSMSIGPDQRVFCILRGGEVISIDPDTGEVTTALELDVWHQEEDGGLGLAHDPNFEETGWIYIYYSVANDDLDPDEEMPYNLLARFDADGAVLDPDSEVELLRVIEQRNESPDATGHSAGEIQFGPDGVLYLSTGDDVTPFESDGFTPIDETNTEQEQYADAQGTSADTSDLRGSILRIVPEADGSYTIPDGNFKEWWEGETGETFDDDVVRPEIFAMGFRNPFRFSVDPETGWLYMGDYGPDSLTWNADRGPIGIREYNQIREPGFYGFPYVRGPNYPYIDYDFETGESGDPFDPDGPINDSPNNHGLEELPPVPEATLHVPTDWNNYLDAPDSDVWNVPDEIPWPQLTDRAPNGGPLVRLPETLDDGALPEYFEGKWFIGEWNTGNFKYVSFDEDGEVTEISEFLSDLDLSAPHDMEIGPAGRFYYVDYDQNAIYRIDADGE
ncbi:ThuA domain-containing protein [Halobacteria archaeon AArc-dxtr1]|nr:ThuA domain-containing protein [Halobacteria archaeon AArc-dxtr1]